MLLFFLNTFLCLNYLKPCLHMKNCLVAGVHMHMKKSCTYFMLLTDDVQILLEVKERDAAGVQTFPCQL